MPKKAHPNNVINRKNIDECYHIIISRCLDHAKPNIIDKPVYFSDDGYIVMTKWALSYPLKTVLYYTVPDCRKER